MKLQTVFSVLFFIIFLTLAPVFSNSNSPQSPNPASSEFIIGADISGLPEAEANGAVFRVNNIEKEALQIFKDHWFNYQRITLWYSDWNQYKSLANAVTEAKRFKNYGFKYLLNIQYSDNWTNPGVQDKPEKWKNLSFDALEDSVYQYTRRVLEHLKKHNVLPDMVQLGNEISYGIMWDDGRVNDDFDTPAQWQKFGRLLKAGVQGVRDTQNPENPVEIMLHHAAGESKDLCKWFFDNLVTQGVEWDVIGLSCYSYWGGRMNKWEENLEYLARRYNKEIIMVEISYPWTLQEYDEILNWMPDPARLHPGYPASVAGQQQFIEDAITLLRNTPKGLGRGLFYWSPADVSTPMAGSGGENIALFDFHSVLLPSIAVFTPEDVVQICLTLNAASIPDTLGVNSVFHIRGAVNGDAPVTLPDGNLLDWSENSEIQLANQGGDFYKAFFFVPAGAEVKFKFWSESVQQSGLGNGWEIGNSNGDGDGNMVVTVNNNMDLKWHFFNGSDSQKAYEWRPWEVKKDQIAVWFRVYANTDEGVQDGYDPNAKNLTIGVRGENLGGAGPLDPNQTKIYLQRELDEEDRAGYHLFSGVAYFPESVAGSEQKYRFAIGANQTEAIERSFVIPGQDTTLHWVYYGNSTPIVPGNPQVTLRLNAATIPDTIGTDAKFVVRGSVNGQSPFTLPDGRIIALDKASGLELSNSEGDLFEITFPVPKNAELAFNFWSEDAERLGLNNGMDTGDLERDSQGNMVITARTNTTLSVHYLNCGEVKKNFAWRPWVEKEDSVAVWLRVFMNTLEGVKDGYDPNLSGQIVTVRGEKILNGEGPLDWGDAGFVLTRESDDKNSAAFHIFSGAIYYPKILSFRPNQDFKFVLGENGWEDENLSGNRSFSVPVNDSTLHWVYFGNTKPVQEEILQAIPGKIEAEDYKDAYGVQTETTDDAGGGLNVGYIDDGDWMDYSVNVAEAGNYEVVFRIAKPDAPAATAELRSGSTTLVSFPVPQTGNWQTWLSISSKVQLTQGKQTLRLYATQGGWNINWFEFTKENVPENEHTIPGKIEAELYADMSGIETETTGDVGGGLNVGYMDAGDWLDYNINVTRTGTYSVGLRVALESGYSSSSGQFKIGDNELATFVVPSTGGWQTYQTIYTTVTLNAGRQILRLYVQNGPWNFNWMEFSEMISDAANGEYSIPSQFRLHSNFPNPFNQSTTIQYELPQTGDVQITIYDLNGRIVHRLNQQNVPAGFYSQKWNGLDKGGKAVASGVYFYQIRILSTNKEFQPFVDRQKMILLR